MCGWQVKLCDPSLTRAIPERFRDEYRTHYEALYTNVLFTYLSLDYNPLFHYTILVKDYGVL